MDKFKKKYCNNCGKIGHLHKICNEPITSIGILGIRIDLQEKYITDLTNYIKNKNNVMYDNDHFGIRIESINDSNLFSIYKENIKMLMIRRRFTLGFMEFIRGRYKLDNIMGISFLFKQMIQEEVDLILSKDFDTLWNLLWNPTKVNPDIDKSNEYIQSEEKFNILKDKKSAINVYKILEKVKITLVEPEWGFPKGRRNPHESNISCAIREFKEETGLTTNDYILFDNIAPLEENFIGTNGIRYRHIYYIAFITTKKEMTLSKANKTQQQEIGDIGLFGFDSAVKMIRPYHIDRINIVSNIFIYIINTLIMLYYKDHE